MEALKASKGGSAEEIIMLLYSAIRDLAHNEVKRG